MSNSYKIKIEAYVDFVISVFFIIIGLLVIVLGNDLFDVFQMISYSFLMYVYVAGMMPGDSSMGGSMNPMGSFQEPLFLTIGPWIIIMLGVACLIYGIKRLLDNCLKIYVETNCYKNNM